jgi:polyisoprenoid-binding protein YceI
VTRRRNCRTARRESAKYLGAFHDIQGVILFDPDNTAASSVQAEIATASVDTSNRARDAGELQYGGFLNGLSFPKITCASTGIEKSGDKTAKISGDLSMAGVTVPVTLDVIFNGEARSLWDGRMRANFGPSYVWRCWPDEPQSLHCFWQEITPY